MLLLIQILPQLLEGGRLQSRKRSGQENLLRNRLSAQEEERHGAPIQPSLHVASSPVAPVKGASENLPGLLDSIGKIRQTRYQRDRKELYLSQPVRALPAPVPDTAL